MTPHYPDSKVEVHGFVARHYDILMDIFTAGRYGRMIKDAVEQMGIRPEDRILDMGSGTGRNACLMRSHLSDKGEIIGLDISSEMIGQFRRRCSRYGNVSVREERIDAILPYMNDFDRVFISFVLHGFPHKVRLRIVRNAYNALRRGGWFHILDYNTFSLEEKPFYVRGLFRAVECPYAYDFIEREWHGILAEMGFGDMREKLYLKGTVRILSARKR